MFLMAKNVALLALATHKGAIHVSKTLLQLVMP
jgi:hypothetical protein